MLNTTGAGTRWNKQNDFRIVRRDEKRVLGFGSFLRAEKLMNLYITHLGRSGGGRAGVRPNPGIAILDRRQTSRPFAWHLAPG